MYPEIATIEIYRNGRWQPAATLRPENTGQGYRGVARFEYLQGYTVENVLPPGATAAGLSCRYPVNFDLRTESHWPAFVLDLLPSGYGRQQWLEQLELNDGPRADWPLLLRGAAFPVGNLRIAEAVAAKDPTRPVPAPGGELLPANGHPGFSRADIARRDEYFIEYAHQLGIYAAGGSDVQGVAPKMLLAEDLQGAWHAEGLLPDERVKAHWLVKLPRGRSAADRKVLKNEAAYMQVARGLGLAIHGLLERTNDCLFIPRFDRRVKPDSSIERFGLESLCSLAGISDFAVPVSHNALCRALISYVDDPAVAVMEYIKRDIANVVLGNKDNHARNTAVLRHENGAVELAPLFDFAPMYLDPEGIPRVCRWEGEAETAGIPDWGKVASVFEELLPEARMELRQFGQVVQCLPDLMQEAGVDTDIIEARARSISEHARQLLAL